jgi:hypothetical protein
MLFLSNLEGLHSLYCGDFNASRHALGLDLTINGGRGGVDIFGDFN